MTNSTNPSTVWALGDYPDIGIGGAAKLLSSAVAPLVCFARGYVSVNRDNVATISKEHRLPNRRTSQGRRFAEAIDAGDVMLMPWFGLTGLVTAHSAGKLPVSSSMQYRPDVPAVFDGREVKYEFVIGDRTPVEAHPATPVSWLTGELPIIVAEGQLKADSALTAMLLDAGHTHEDLKVAEGETVELALARLSAMLMALDKPYLILGIAGVHNWRHNAGEWQWVTLSGRSVLLGMDGDVATNPAVHSSTSMLWTTLQRGKATPYLIAIDAEAAGDDHLGIDDYLAQHGTWTELLAMVATELPPFPSALSADQVGKFRISDSMISLEKCLPVKDPATGEVVRGVWENAGIDIGARVASFTTSRVPTKTEEETGVLEPAANLGDATVEIEAGWLDPTDGSPRTGIIEGPADILNFTPDRWVDKGAKIPYTLLVHPHWPPSGPDARFWVQAVKEFRAADRDHVTRWTRMGWVPQPEGRLPAFIVGDQIVGDSDSANLVISGVSDDTLSECSSFGVDDLDARDFTNPKYLKKLAKAWTWLIENYLLGDAWTDRKVGSLVVAMGLRPCLPLRTNTSAYFSGPPAGGKSWSAAAVAAFWSRRRGTWSNKHLPGTAKDSAAFMAANLSQAVLWVADDLAPGTSRAKAEQERASVEDMIRSVHNGKRAGRANSNGSARRDKDPISLLVVTAENPPEAPSVRQRTILVNFAKGSLAASVEPTQKLVDGYTDANIPAFITQGFLKFLRHYAASQPEGWARLVDEVAATKMSERKTAEEYLKAQTKHSPGTETRAAEIASDLMVVMPFVAKLMAWHLADFMKPDHIELFTRLSSSSLVDETDKSQGSIKTDIAELVAEGWEKSLGATPGRNLLRAISASLRANKAHIISGDDPKREPGRSPQESVALGWQMASDPARPCGEPIGWMLTDGHGVPYVFLDPQNAFKVAYATYPKLIGEGQSATSSWQAFYDDELHHKEIEREAGRNKKPQNRSRISVGKGEHQTRRYGVPVRLDTLLEADEG